MKYLFGLRMNFGFYFDRIFAGNEAGSERYRLLFELIGDLEFERGKGVNSITVGVLMILRSYNYRKKLDALAKLSGSDEGFDDRTPHLEQAHEAGDGVTEEEVLDGIMALGDVHMWMSNGVCGALF